MRIILALALTMVVGQASAQQTVTVTTTLPEMQKILNAIGQGAWNDVNPLMKKLIDQVNAQIAPAPQTTAPPSPPKD